MFGGFAVIHIKLYTFAPTSLLVGSSAMEETSSLFACLIYSLEEERMDTRLVGIL